MGRSKLRAEAPLRHNRKSFSRTGQPDRTAGTRFVLVATLLVVVVLSFDGAAAAAQTDPLLQKAEAFVDAMSRGDYASAALGLDQKMTEVFGPDKMAEFWKAVPEKFGAFRRYAASRRDNPLPPYEIVLVTCEFEKVTLDARVVFDREARIAGLNFVPSLPPAKYERPAYARPGAFEEKGIRVGRGDWELPGTLTLPKGPGPFPALVLVHGSGPNDRDETIGPNQPFRDLAWGLASRGIAVLRYDKRTRVYGPKIVADKALASSLTVKEEVVDDALSAVEVLLAEPGVDRSAVYALGHSLGGTLVPRIAAADRNGSVAGYVIMAGATQPLEDTMVRQMTYLLGLDGGLSEDDRRQLDQFRAQAARIKAFTPADAASGENVMGAGPAYWLDLKGYDPPAAAKAIERPLLILQGARDYQVTIVDFDNWKTALAGRPDVAFRLYPKLNHLFAEGLGFSTPAEYTQAHASVAAEVIEDIAAWIKAGGRLPEKPTAR
jgi:dienelactone hydrolase